MVEYVTELRNHSPSSALATNNLPGRKCKALVTLAGRYHDAVASTVGMVFT